MKADWLLRYVTQGLNVLIGCHHTTVVVKFIYFNSSVVLLILVNELNKSLVTKVT